jgi:hypothetical protein
MSHGVVVTVRGCRRRDDQDGQKRQCGNFKHRFFSYLAHRALRPLLSVQEIDNNDFQFHHSAVASTSMPLHAFC